MSDIYKQEWSNIDPDQLINDAIVKLNDDVGAIFESNVLEALKKVYKDDPARFARYRQQIKDSKKVDLTMFTKLVSQQPEQESNSSFELFPPIKVWDNPVNGEQLLNEIKDIIKQYIIADEPTIIATALWVTYTWFIDVVSYAPIANITAPEKRCGKSSLLSVIKKLSYKSLSTSNISAAALFRLIELYKPTLLIDEVDTFLALHEEMRGIINAGFTRESAFIIRCVGDEQTPTPFNVWGAKGLSGIGKVADTLQDRSITLRLRRKRKNESVKNVDRSNNKQWDLLRSKLARFAQDNKDIVRVSNPEPIPQLNDRANDCWLPLLQVASVAGGHWLETAIKTALLINGAEEEPQSIKTELLIAIKDIFDTKKIDRVFSHDLANYLNEDNESSWILWNKGRGMTPNTLAKQLRDYGIVSNTLRIGFNRAKGYQLNQFLDAFSRYIPSFSLYPPFTNVTTGQLKGDNESSGNLKRDKEEMSRLENQLQTKGGIDCHVVTFETPPNRKKKENEVNNEIVYDDNLGVGI